MPAGDPLNPPSYCCCRNNCVCNGSRNTGIYGGGGPQDFRLTREMGADIHDLVRALRSLIEDVRITFGIEVKAGDKLSETVMVNGAGIESPMHGMNLNLSMRDNEATLTGQVHNDSHRFDIPDAMHGNRDGQGA